MILTCLLPGALLRPERKGALARRLDFLESLLADIDNGLSVHQSFHRHRYPALANTEIQKFFTLAFNQGMSVSQPLQELIRQTHFLIDREREIAIEIAPARATLNLLTFFPVVILGGALISGIINLDRQLFAPIPIAMIGLSLLLQIAGRRWSQGIITNIRT